MSKINPYLLWQPFQLKNSVTRVACYRCGKIYEMDKISVAKLLDRFDHPDLLDSISAFYLETAFCSGCHEAHEDLNKNFFVVKSLPDIEALAKLN